MFMPLSKSCTIENKISVDGHHSITYGTALTVACNYHLEHEHDESGSIIVTSGWVVLPVGTTVTHESLVTVDGYQPPIKLIKDIENYRTGVIEGIKLEF